MNICTDDLTIGQVKELAKVVSGMGGVEVADHPYHVGKNYFIRTVTHHYTGRLVRVLAQELVLEDAAWIADDGRFSKALEEGELNEVEPFPAGEVIIGRGSIVDATIWGTALPRKVK